MYWNHNLRYTDNHKKYPVKVDFKGISLSTSLFEQVTVVFENQNNHAILH